MSPSPTSALISLNVKHFFLWVFRLSTGVLQGGTGRCIIKQLACLRHISRERPRGPGVFRAGGAGENSSAQDWQLLSEAPSTSAPSTLAELKCLAYYFQSPVIFSSQIFSSQLVLKEKIFDVVKTCIGRNDEISKTRGRSSGILLCQQSFARIEGFYKRDCETKAPPKEIPLQVRNDMPTPLPQIAKISTFGLCF